MKTFKTVHFFLRKKINFVYPEALPILSVLCMLPIFCTLVCFWFVLFFFGGGLLEGGI